MGRIPQETIDDVLQRTDIMSVVQRYVTLKRSGTSHKGLCPFHQEKTPSFYVTPSRGIFKCFGCGAGGNVIKFLMDIEGWSFPEVVRTLAGEAGIEIPEQTTEEEEASRQRMEERKLYQQGMQLARESSAPPLSGPAAERARSDPNVRALA